MNGKPLIRKIVLNVISVLFLALVLVAGWQIYESITRRLPIAQPNLHLAQTGVAHNADWKPVIRRFNHWDWALVPAGCFNMGSTESQLKAALRACETYGGENCPYVFDQVAQPDSPVCFEKPYWIGLTEATNRDYGSNSSTDMISMYRAATWPRETVTWKEAADFCRRNGSRLPTEAEWEYAARGPDAWIYPWGDEPNSTYRQEAEMLNPYDVESVDVDTSWVGARGMSGNVMEWVADVFDPSSAPVNSKATEKDDRRIVRGGSWASYQDFLLRTTQRIPFDPEYASSVIGFRCMHDFEEMP